jgi:hypothetical protein
MTKSITNLGISASTQLLGRRRSTSRRPRFSSVRVNAESLSGPKIVNKCHDLFVRGRRVDLAARAASARQVIINITKYLPKGQVTKYIYDHVMEVCGSGTFRPCLVLQIHP